MTEHRDCSRCLLGSSCPFCYVFDTPVPENSVRMRKYTAAPHPFVFEPEPDDRQDYAAGDELAFRLILVGKAVDLLPYFVLAFQRMGERHGLGRVRGRLRLVKVNWLPFCPVRLSFPADAGNQEVNLITPEDSRLKAGYRASTITDLIGTVVSSWSPYRRLTVDFVTPCRLIRAGALTDRPDFHVILRSLLRRVSSLAYFHCSSELDLDHRALALAAEHVRLIEDHTQWFDWERWSSRQKTRMILGGILGRAVYEGDFNPFIPLLKLGEVLHVGKGTTFGLGKYSITLGAGSGGM